MATDLQSIVQQAVVVACGTCAANDWIFEGDSILRCGSCNATVPRQHNLINCLPNNNECGSMIGGWQAYYGERADSYSTNKDWWTLTSWKKFLFAGVLDDLAGKLVVDVGCGTAVRVATIAPIEEHGYQYVGVDSSMAALERAARNMPGGLFICADLASLNLRPKTADIVLCLGVLMYFPAMDRLLGQILRVLKPGGVLLLHEQLRRKAWGRLAGGASTPQRDGPPEGYGIQESELCMHLAQHGRMKSIHRSGSPFRSALIPLLNHSTGKIARPLAAWFDSTWCASIGRIVPDLGAGEIQLVFEKFK